MLEKLQKFLREDPQQFDTPCYVYNIGTAARNYLDLRKQLGTGLILSVKANPNMDVHIHLSHIATDGYELASLAELNGQPKTMGAPLFINNPSMDRNLIRAGLGAKAHFIIDSIDQIRAILPLAEHRPVMPLLLRLNASVLKKFKPDAVQLRSDHFGLDWESVCEAIALIRQSAGKLTLGGLHLFSGSHTFLRSAWDIAAAAPDIVRQVEALYGAPLTYLNLGGGFAHDWREHAFDFAAYREKLAALPRHLKLFHESGRGVFASSGAFLTRVVSTKRIDGKHYAVCDGGINQNFLLCQTENQLRRLRAPLLHRRQDPASDGVKVPVHFVGSSCNRDDVIGISIDPIVPPQPGDICIFDQCGAYNATYTVSRFLGLKEAATYVIPCE